MAAILPAMASVSALFRTIPAARPGLNGFLREGLRGTVVCGCALALILAGSCLPT